MKSQDVTWVQVMEAMLHHHLYQALVTMVKATQTHSHVVLSKWYQNGMADPKAFSKEFRTVRFGLGRRMGHTTMGLRLCDEVAPNASLFLTLDDINAKYARKKSDRTVVMPLSSAVSLPLQIDKYKIIVVDLANFASKTKLDKLQSLVTETPTVEDPGPLFVLLQ